MSAVHRGGVHVPAGAGRALPIRRMGVTLRVASDATDGSVACVVKPRGVFHTFWNTGEHPVRFLEVISPGGLERYYEEISRLIPASGPVEIERILALAGSYGVEFDMTSLLDIMEANPVRLV